ncbi:hypothetical protein BC2230_50492 [Burkholderia cepacia]
MNAGRQAVRTPFGANAGGKGRIVALRSHLSVTTPRRAPPTVRAAGPGRPARSTNASIGLSRSVDG